MVSLGSFHIEQNDNLPHPIIKMIAARFANLIQFKGSSGAKDGYRTLGNPSSRLGIGLHLQGCPEKFYITIYYIGHCSITLCNWIIDTGFKCYRQERKNMEIISLARCFLLYRWESHFWHGKWDSGDGEIWFPTVPLMTLVAPLTSCPG